MKVCPEHHNRGENLPQLTYGNAAMMQHINPGFEDMLMRTNLVWPAAQSTAYTVTHNIINILGNDDK